MKKQFWQAAAFLTAMFLFLFGACDNKSSPLPKDDLTGTVEISYSGTKIVAGDTLTGTVTDSNATDTTRFVYEWQLNTNNEPAGWNKISGNSTNTYETKTEDGGKYVKLVVTHPGYDNSCESIVHRIWGSNEVVPVLDGAVDISPKTDIEAGRVLTADITGAAADLNGLVYTWQRSQYSGGPWSARPNPQNLNTYETDRTDAGYYIRVAVTHPDYDPDTPLESPAYQIKVDLKSKTIFSGSHSGRFTIAKSGGRQFEIDHSNLRTEVIHGDMDFEWVTPGGYIEAKYEGPAPKLRLTSVSTQTGKAEDQFIDGADSSAGIRRYNSDIILDTIEANYGHLNMGTRDPTVMALIQVGENENRNPANEYTGTIKEITVYYDANHSSLQAFTTKDQMREAASAQQPGNITRIKRAMVKAAAEQPVTIAFLGGSITEAGNGAGAYKLNGIQVEAGSPPAKYTGGMSGYSGKVANWFASTFPNIIYVNHSIGGVGSGGGIAWLDKFSVPSGSNLGGLLKGPDGTAQTRLHEPDLVFLEFSVNDSMSGFWTGKPGESLDQIIGRVLEESNAGVIVLNSFDLYNGHSADVAHGLAAKRHDVTVVNHRAGLWPNLRGTKHEDRPDNWSAMLGFGYPLSYDSVHPSDNTGHEAYADFIKYRLEQIKNDPLNYVLVSGLTISDSVLSISVDSSMTGEVKPLGATISPNTANNKTVIWTSSNPSVATVDSNGVVTARTLGTTTITAKSQDAPDIFKTCAVTVTGGSGYVPVTGVSLNKASTTFNLTSGSSTETLTATIITAGGPATNQRLEWTSSNTFAAVVDGDGVVTGLRSGMDTTTITVKTIEGGFEASCEVTVKGTVFPTGITAANLTNISNGKADVVLWESTTGGVSANNWEQLVAIYSPDVTGISDAEWAYFNPAWIIPGTKFEYTGSGSGSQYVNLIRWEANMNGQGPWPPDETMILYGNITGWGADPMTVKSIHIASSGTSTLTKVVMKGIPYEPE
ncbi:MAG: Ig-like domain-containing protein [Treponema sp.]|jgi:uncharacterized protein YjdB/lysophospholipase L1-like esterase|nr:Ig-like domain-containing protein [Treponema sp.]